MNIDKTIAKQLLPLIAALADGKTLEFNNGTTDCPIWNSGTDWGLDQPLEKYRIKKEPREVYINLYTNGELLPHVSKDSAIGAFLQVLDRDKSDRMAVKFVEVLEEDC